jgi:hypothetical protein
VVLYAARSMGGGSRPDTEIQLYLYPNHHKKICPLKSGAIWSSMFPTSSEKYSYREKNMGLQRCLLQSRVCNVFQKKIQPDLRSPMRPYVSTLITDHCRPPNQAHQAAREALIITLSIFFYLSLVSLKIN